MTENVNYDEVFTRYEDIEKELSMYDKSIWKNKVVYCNCDNPAEDENHNISAFSIYFLRNFDKLKLKKLICTNYSKPVGLFNQGVNGYVFSNKGFHELKEGYSGSFDDPFSLKILKEEADIVCTNPPFSRTADYWKIIIESGKKFIIISNIANVQNQPYISYFKEKKVWEGYNRVDHFLTPKKQLIDGAGHWYTNIPITK